LFVKKELSGLISIISPVAKVSDLKIDNITSSNITFENGFEIESVKLAMVLKNSKKATFMALTIGEKLTLEVEEALKKEEYTKAVIIDAIGSEAVEKFADYIQDVIARENRLFSLKPTMRFSPGYGDFSLSYQKEILLLLEAEEIGISLHPESLVLIPEKSITAVVGWE
jgi:Methionine synthase I, cobalamin-binding domain